MAVHLATLYVIIKVLMCTIFTTKRYVASLEVSTMYVANKMIMHASLHCAKCRCWLANSGKRRKMKRGIEWSIRYWFIILYEVLKTLQWGVIRSIKNRISGTKTWCNLPLCLNRSRSTSDKRDQFSFVCVMTSLKSRVTYYRYHGFLDYLKNVCIRLDVSLF